MKGWKYFKWGHCQECSDDDAKLYVPVLKGQLVTNNGVQILRGDAIPLFPPLCTGCRKKYSLDVLCEKHHMPLRVADARCVVCPK